MAAPQTSVRQPNPDAHIAVRRLTMAYGDFVVQRDLDFEIARGEVFIIMGDSGCGKSTFLRWINRMNDLIDGARCDGVLNLAGTSLLSRSLDVVDLRRRVGMVFQKPNPFPKSIYENVAFGPKLHVKMA